MPRTDARAPSTESNRRRVSNDEDAPPSPARPSLIPGLSITLIISTILTAVMSVGVVRSPQTMIFGHEIAGRHHDPFTVMQQFASGGVTGLYRQPLTDDVGAALARVVGPIAAYNVLILLSFPLTAVTTYLLGRFLIGSQAGAVTAALAFAFAPAHVAQASYHVHMAQFQWIPLYFLALFTAIDRPRAARLLLLLGAAGGLVLSNDYGGLIAVVVTPVALPAYWLARRTRTLRGLAFPSVTLAAALAVTAIVVTQAFPDVLTQVRRSASFFPEDVARYGARWWAYWLPPVDHPFLAGLTRQVSSRAGLGPGILEQQLYLGWALTMLAVAGVATRRRAPTRAESGHWLPTPADAVPLALATIAAWSFVASLAPASPTCEPPSFALACIGYSIAPMFRAFARVGIVAGLCIALLAGYAVAAFGSRSKRGGRTVAAIPVLLAALFGICLLEFWPFPGRARDVLPTQGHRWLAERDSPVRVLDCLESTPADAALPWLMKKDIRLIATPFEGCDEPELVPKLAALGFTHVLTRTSQAPPWPETSVPGGLTAAVRFPDASVYRVEAAVSPLVVLDVRGFFGWESGGAGDRWRWMGQEGSWTLLNTTTGPLARVLHLVMESFAEPRHLAFELDGDPLPTLEVAVARREYFVGPITLAPGQHALRFRALEPAVRPIDVSGAQDRRSITITIRQWRWTPVPSGQEKIGP